MSDDFQNGSATSPLVELRDVAIHFPVNTGLLQRASSSIKAVDGVSFEIYNGETLGLVGESGCGKSTIARSIVRLIKPTSGEITFDGHRYSGLSRRRAQSLRRDMQFIFQDPYASLNPRWTIGRSISEPLRVQRLPGDHRRDVEAILSLVGLRPADYDRYPHEFSGGQRQRVGIARAVVTRPKLVVCDEPVSALDVSIQAQIINLLRDLQEEFGLTYLLIAHDLAVVRNASERIAVMYLGHIVELASREVLFAEPSHPYTHSLLSAVAVPDPAMERERRRIVLVGEVPSPVSPPQGCVFHTRCPRARPRCSAEAPTLKSADGEGGHLTACFYPVQKGESLGPSSSSAPTSAGRPTAKDAS